jgi:hypothetical protein
MRVATGILGLCLLLGACKGSNFVSKNDSKPKSGEASAAVDEDDDAIALEPTSVGGAYLGCFVDPQISSESTGGRRADELPVGCQTFEDSNFHQVKPNSGLSIEGAELELAGNRKTIGIQPIPQHPRWSWVGKVPMMAANAKLIVQVRANGAANPVTLQLELSDILPAGLALAPEGLQTGTYKIRIKGTSHCLHGNPVWSWDPEASKPLTDPVMLNLCPLALNFRFTRFENGLRLHVPNPKPLTCDTENYAVEHCNESCVDLENFGLGNRFVLWACTRSVQAQSYELLPASKGSVRIQANGRLLTKFGALIIPEHGAAIELEIIPVAP